MKSSTRKFINLLEEKNFNYTLQKDSGYDSEGYDVISIDNRGDNMQNMRFVCFIDDVSINIIMPIAEVSSDKQNIVLKEINKINKDYNGVSFYISEEEVRAKAVFVFNDCCAADICFVACYKLVCIADECYPRIMKCIW